MKSTAESSASEVKAQLRLNLTEMDSSRMTIYVLDLLPTVPYYTGHLCAALKNTPGIDIRLAATTYSHDRTFFARIGLSTCHGLIDLAGKADLGRPICRVGKIVEYLLNLACLAARFLVRRPTLLHVQFLPMAEHRLPFELWFLAVVRSLGIKVVYTVHNVIPHNSKQDMQAFYLRVYRLVDVFICHDRFAKQELISHFGVDAEHVIVIPHGVLFGEQGAEANRSSCEKLGARSNDTIVLWQGIIGPYKGIPFLLSTWKEVQNRGVRGRLLIVGTGDNHSINEIRQQVKDLGLSDSVKLDFRFVPMQELESVYQAADIVVFPYRSISTSGALMTAMRFGKAILASSLPGFKNALENEHNALLVPYGETELWAAALMRLMQDRQLRQELGAAVRVTQREIPGWREIARQTAAVYERALFNTAAALHPSTIN